MPNPVLRHCTVLGVLVLIGCGSDEPASPTAITNVVEATCVPGESRACTCTGSDAGVQVCATDGLSLGACDCTQGGAGGEPSVGGAGGSSSSAGGAGTGASEGGGAGGGGGGAASGGAGGAGDVCVVDDDCPGAAYDFPCVDISCVNGLCNVDPEPAGTLVYDPGGLSCEVDICNGLGALEHANQPAGYVADYTGTPCNKAVCDGLGSFDYEYDATNVPNLSCGTDETCIMNPDPNALAPGKLQFTAQTGPCTTQDIPAGQCDPSGLCCGTFSGGSTGCQ